MNSFQLKRFLQSFVLSLFLLYSLASDAHARSTKSFNQAWTQYLETNEPNAKQWALLESLAWKITVVNELDQDFEVSPGDPLKTHSFDNLKRSKSHLVVKVLKTSLKSDNQLAKSLGNKLNQIIELKETLFSWRIKFADSSKQAAKLVGESVYWPTYADALGEGYNEFFKKTGTPPSWTLKSNKKPSDFFNTLINGTRTYESGCAVTLWGLSNLAGFMSFDDPELYDSKFPSLFINNGVWRSNKNSFIQTLNRDEYGLEKGYLGKWGLIGQPGYIEAILADGVENVDYFGENIVITDANDKAAKDLVKEEFGLGYYRDEEGYENSIWDLEEFQGKSLKMIEWWKKFNELYKKNHDAEASIDEIESNPSLRKYKRYITSAFFTDVNMFGHPAGEFTFKEWILHLATINPNTPYSIVFYDIDPMGSMWKNYKKAYLD